jgi:hypothetical protein
MRVLVGSAIVSDECHNGYRWGCRRSRKLVFSSCSRSAPGPQGRLRASRATTRNCMWNSTTGTVWGAWIGLGAAGTLHPAAFGRCPHPAGIPPGPKAPGVKLVPPRRDAGDGGRPGGDRWLRGLQLDPGSGRMVPVTRVGRSALRAAAPAGQGRAPQLRPRNGRLASPTAGAGWLHEGIAPGVHRGRRPPDVDRVG